MPHKWKYPTPTQQELDDPPIYSLSFNPFWWAVIQGKIGELANPALWDDYTPEIEAAIEALMIPEDLP